MIKELKATGLALGLSGLLATSAFAGVDVPVHGVVVTL